MLQSPFKLDYTWSYSHNPSALRLNKPIEHGELFRLFPNLKGINIEFGKAEFRVKKLNQDDYLEKLLDTFDLEELIIDNHNNLTRFPNNLWKPSLKRLELSRLGRTDGVQELIIDKKCHLEGILIDFKYILLVFEPTILSSFTQVLTGEVPKKQADLSKLKNLTEVVFYNNESVEILNNCRNLQYISLTPSVNKLNLDLANFPKLLKFQVDSNNNIRCEDVLDFSKNQQLQFISLSNFKNFPLGLSQGINLRHISLFYIGNPTLLGKICFKSFDKLSFLSLYDCYLDYELNSFLGEMPTVGQIHIKVPSGYNPKFSTKLFTSKQLRYLHISNCQLVTNEPNTESIEPVVNLTLENTNLSDESIDCLENFEHISCNGILNEKLGLKNWGYLQNIKGISISGADNLTELMAIDKKNTSLKYIGIDKLSALKSLPDSFVESNITSLSISNCPNLEINRWDSFPSLENLIIQGLIKKIPKELLLWSNLKKVSIDKSLVSSANSPFLEDITKITLDYVLSKETKLIIGSILFEDGIGFENIENNKPAFLEIFNSKSFRFKQMAWENLHLINSDFTFTLDFLAQKSICLLGKTKNIKSYYKDKLVALKANYQSKISFDTEIIVIGENFELPDGFWKHQHYFISEVQLDTLIKDFQPGFVQTLGTNEIHNLRELLWSNEVENEKIVLEMIKGGGIADAIIPDLIAVAKTSQDESVKNSLKKILKAKLDAGGQKIISDKTNLRRPPSWRNPFEMYQSYGSTIDVSQIAVTWAKRNSENGYFEFFKIKSSEQNPYRQQIFMSVYPQFLVRPHYVDARWNFTNTEINFTLSQPVLIGKLKRLLLGKCDLLEILPSLLLHKDTLDDFTFSTSEVNLSEEISEFQKIKQLNITSPNLETLPITLTKMKKLKELYIYNDKSLRIYKELTPLKDLARFYCSGGYEFSE